MNLLYHLSSGGDVNVCRDVMLKIKIYEYNRNLTLKVHKIETSPTEFLLGDVITHSSISIRVKQKSIILDLFFFHDKVYVLSPRREAPVERTERHRQ